MLLKCVQNSRWSILFQVYARSNNNDCYAAITMIDSNSVDFWRNKHWLVRRNYIREEVENKECKLKYTPTEDMIADMGKHFENVKY